jgi:hypothetical protein
VPFDRFKSGIVSPEEGLKSQGNPTFPDFTLKSPIDQSKTKFQLEGAGRQPFRVACTTAWDSTPDMKVKIVDTSPNLIYDIFGKI